jgi:hypothetical protein
MKIWYCSQLCISPSFNSLKNLNNDAKSYDYITTTHLQATPVVTRSRHAYR